MGFDHRRRPMVWMAQKEIADAVLKTVNDRHQRQHDVVPDQLELGVPDQVFDVLPLSRKEVVKT